MTQIQFLLYSFARHLKIWNFNQKKSSLTYREIAFIFFAANVSFSFAFSFLNFTIAGKVCSAWCAIFLSNIRNSYFIYLRAWVYIWIKVIWYVTISVHVICAESRKARAALIIWAPCLAFRCCRATIVHGLIDVIGLPIITCHKCISPPISAFIMQILHHATPDTVIYLTWHHSKVSIHTTAATRVVSIHNFWINICVLLEPVVNSFVDDSIIVRHRFYVVRALAQILTRMIVAWCRAALVMIKLTIFYMFAGRCLQFIIPKLEMYKVTWCVYDKKKLCYFVNNLMLMKARST